MAEIRIRFDLAFSRRCVVAAAALAVVAVSPPDLVSENVTLSTYYPAPSGVYTQMIATDNSWFARDGGSVFIGPEVSTTTVRPTRITVRTGNLDVLDGTVMMANLSADPLSGRNGEVYYNVPMARFRGFAGGAWKDLAPDPPVVFRSVCRGCKNCTSGGVDQSWCGPADTRLGNANCSPFLVIQNQNDGDQDQVEEVGCYIDDVSQRLYIRLETSGGDDEETTRDSVCGAICGGQMVINP